MKRIQQLLAQIGLEPERARMVNLSSAMAGEFVAAVTQMTEQVAVLGPSPLRVPRSNPDKPDAESEA
jgi:coenzyme F420-reducing hydrogenase delta subunit